MTRMSKQGKRRAKCPKKRQRTYPIKTGSKKDNLPEGFRVHENATGGSSNVFIGKVK